MDLEITQKLILSETKDPHKAIEYQQYFKTALKLLHDLRTSPSRSVQKVQSIYIYNCDKCHIEFKSWYRRREHMIKVHSV